MMRQNSSNTTIGIAPKKPKMEWQQVVSLKQFSATLNQLFKGREMGTVYKEAQQNIFFNEYLGDLQKIKQGIDLNLIGSKEKRDNMDNIDQYFTDQVSKKKFYDQAKNGKLSTEFKKEESLAL